MARLSLALLGAFEVTLQGQAVTAFEYDKVRALLAYLAVESDRPHRRETLAGFLWPEQLEHKARQNLSQALFKLRRTIGDYDTKPPFLIITPQTLQFNQSSDYKLDVKTFIAQLAASKTHDHYRLEACEPCLSRLKRGLSLYRGDFLEGFSVGSSPAFEEWSVLNRERLHRMALEAFSCLADAYELRGEDQEALKYAWQQVELEPWCEKAHQQLMRLLALNGQRGAALAQYEACRRILAKELGIGPAAETLVLLEQIQAGVLKPRLLAPPHRPGSCLIPPAYLSETVGQTQATKPAFVARENELAILDENLELALGGQGRIVFIVGEAGYGKTALIQEFIHRWLATHPDLIVAVGRTNAYTSAGDPLLPFRQVLNLLTGDIEASWSVGAIMQQYADRLWNLLPHSVGALLDSGPDLLDSLISGTALMSRARAFAQRSGDASWLARLEQFVQRKELLTGHFPYPQSDLFEQYARVVRTLAQEKPLLLVIDNLQWADPGSIGLLSHLGGQLEGSRILIVGTYRPVEVALGYSLTRRASTEISSISSDCRDQHPLELVINEFTSKFGAIEIDLSRLEGRRFVDEFLDSIPNQLGETFRQRLYVQTGGHPLFTVELLQGMRERGDLILDKQGNWVEGAKLDWETLPARVEAVIAERIGRLPEHLREALTVASVEGDTFTAE